MRLLLLSMATLLHRSPMDVPGGGSFSATNANVTPQAINPVNGAVSTGVAVIDDFGADSTIEIIIANTGGSNATVTDFDLFPGPGVASPAALPAGMTITSPFSSIANLRDYVNKVPLQVTGIQLDTDDATNNYASYLKVADIRPDGTAQQRTIRLSNYRVGNGGGTYQNVIDVTDQLQNFQLNAQKRFRIGHIHAATTMIIRLQVPASARRFVYDAIKY